MYTTRHHVTSPVIYTNIILLYVILALREISAASMERTLCKAGCITYTHPLVSTTWSSTIVHLPPLCGSHQLLLLLTP